MAEPEPDAAAEVRAALRTVRTGTWPLPVEAVLAVLEEREQLRKHVAALEAIVAEGNQRDRALALLLLRDGGQVEFSVAEQVSAPWGGELISYPNRATGGLVLLYSPGAASDPEQLVPELADAGG